jgi:hypothetical protein
MFLFSRFLRLLAWLGFFSVFILNGSGSPAEVLQSFDLPAGGAEVTLKQFSIQSGVEVLYSTEAVRGVRTKAVKGRLLADEAVKQMLSGTPLYVVTDRKNGVWRIARTTDPNG